MTFTLHGQKALLVHQQRRAEPRRGLRGALHAIVIASVSLAGGALLGACRKSSEQLERKEPLVVADQPQLPENPELGKKSEAQWRKHLDQEEDERQGIFDRQRLEQHRALMKLLSGARKTLDEQKGMNELNEANVEVTQRLTTARAQLKQLDPWGTNSRLLPEYKALLELLGTPYLSAKQSAFGGDSKALDAARMQFDAHLRKMNKWLEHIQDEEVD